MLAELLMDVRWRNYKFTMKPSAENVDGLLIGLLLVVAPKKLEVLIILVFFLILRIEAWDQSQLMKS